MRARGLVICWGDPIVEKKRYLLENHTLATYPEERSAEGGSATLSHSSKPKAITLTECFAIA